jgi:hypothetical protein
LEHKKKNKKRKFTNSVRNGAGLSDRCAVAQGSGAMAQARKKTPYI